MLIKSLGVIEADPFAAFIEGAFETKFEVGAASPLVYKLDSLPDRAGHRM